MQTRTDTDLWSVLKGAMDTSTPVECCVTHVVPGGLQVLIHGFIAFLPQSQLELGDAFPLESYIGKSLRTHVLNLHSANTSITVGRKKFLSQIKQQRQDHTLHKIQPGDILRGSVKKLASYGAFVDLNGVDGLIRNHDLSWSKTLHPSEILRVGEHVHVKVITINCVTRHVDLSLRETRPDPWHCVEAWPIGSIRQGTIVNVVDYGYFVRLLDGVEGLLHINNLRGTPGVLLRQTIIDVVILSVDTKNKRMSLELCLQ